MIVVKSKLLDKCLIYIPMLIMWLILAFFILTTIFQVVPLEKTEDRGYLLIFFFACAIFVFYLSYLFLVMPTKIIVMPDYSFILSGPLKTTSSYPSKVDKIEADIDGDWYIICENKKIDLRFFQNPQLEPFINIIKENNPSI